MSTDKAYARCAACDRSFYPSWRKAEECYEDLCWSCKKVAQYTARVDPVLYGTPDSQPIHPDKWEQSIAEETDDYLGTLWEDRAIIQDSLLEQDDYTKGTGIDVGEWFGANNPFDTYEVS